MLDYARLAFVYGLGFGGYRMSVQPHSALLPLLQEADSIDWGPWMSDQAWTGLTDAIKAIRAELQAAIEPEAGLRFRAGPVELEFTVDVHTDQHGKVSVRLLPWLGTEGSAGHASGSVHRLKVTLQPVDEGGKDSTIGTRTFGLPE